MIKRRFLLCFLLILITGFSNIAFANAPLLSQQLKVALDKAEHLIDDLLYSEHIFEKLSVFGEYTETILKHHRASTPRMIV